MTVTATAGVAALALTLTACGSSDSDDASGSDGASGDEDITLTVATFNEFGYEDLITEYEDLYPNITVQQKKAATADEARDSLRNSLGADSGASDIEAIEVDWLAEFKQYPDKFEDLTNADVEGRWLDWKTDAATLQDGSLIGYGTDIGPEAVCYRADLFEAAGLPSERGEVAEFLGESWDDYFDAGKEFMSNSDVPWFDSAGATWQGMINQVQNAYEDNDGTVIATENPEVRDNYEAVLAAAVDDNLSAHLSQWSPDWTDSFQSDGFATMLCPGWMLGVIEGNAAGIEGWDIADTFPGGGGNWGGSYLTVPAQGENVAAARELAAWLTAPEQQLKAFESKGTFPSQVEALDSDELAAASNPFFADAPTGEILANRANAVSVTPFKGANYFPINTAMSDAITRVDVDQTDDVDSSWEKFVSDVNALG